MIDQGGGAGWLRSRQDMNNSQRADEGRLWLGRASSSLAHSPQPNGTTPNNSAVRACSIYRPLPLVMSFNPLLSCSCSPYLPDT
jgi:hypothetical protein